MQTDGEERQRPTQPDNFGLDVSDRTELHEHDGCPVEHDRDNEQEKFKIAHFRGNMNV